MSKRIKIYFSIFIVVVGLMMYLEYTKPKPVDWSKTFSVYDKIPFGAYVLNQELPKLFPEKNIQLVEYETITAFLREDDYTLNDSSGVFFILGANYQSFSKTDNELLLEFVQNGNDVFLATDYIPYYIADTLKIRRDYIWASVFSGLRSDTIYATLTNEYLDDKKYYFPRKGDYFYFSAFDTINTTVLGNYGNDSSFVNFIKTPYGNGNFYIHLLPDAFGNYHLLNDSVYTYAINSLNYLRKDNIYWYEYKKSINARDNESLLMYIFSNPPLHWAWVILLVGAFVYLFFAGKRVQRIIPIITPLQNSIVEFTKTVGNMYYNSHQHNDLIQKKIKYFLSYVRETYFLDIKNINDEFSHLLHLKSNASKKTTDKIVYLIKKANATETSSEEDLKNLNEIIERFFIEIQDAK